MIGDDTDPGDAPPAAPPLGHNGINMSAEQFYGFVRRIANIDAEIAVLREKKKKITAEIKQTGTRKDAFDHAVKLNDMDADDRRSYLAQVEAMLGYFRTPEGVQFTFDLPAVSPGETDEQTARRLVAKAYHEGFTAGVKGSAWLDENPHGAETEAGQAWIRGHHDGQREAARNMGPLDKVKESAEREAEAAETDDTDETDGTAAATAVEPEPAPDIDPIPEPAPADDPEPATAKPAKGTAGAKPRSSRTSRTGTKGGTKGGRRGHLKAVPS